MTIQQLHDFATAHASSHPRDAGAIVTMTTMYAGSRSLRSGLSVADQRDCERAVARIQSASEASGWDAGNHGITI